MAKKSAPLSKLDPKTKKRYITAGISFVVIAAVIYFLFLFPGLPKNIKTDDTEGEVRDAAELALKDKPYVSLTPTSDGAEIIISIENMANFDRIEYELTYLADNPQVSGEKIQRGATGTDVNTKDQKYKKSVLLGTASRGVRSPDRGVSDGKLTMHLIKGDVEFLSETEWNLFETGGQTTTIADTQDKISLEVPATLGKTYWVILAETIGVPPTFDKDVQTVITPVFGAFSVAPEFTKPADLTLKLENSPQSPQVHLYSQEGKWQTKDLNTQGENFTTTISNFATFIVTSAQ